MKMLKRWITVTQKRQKRTFTLAFILLTASLTSNTQAAHPPVVATKTDAAAAANRLIIRYNKGLIDALIEQAPLGEVLREFNAKCGLLYHHLPPAIANQLVSVRIAGLPLEQAIRRILGGFSYVFYKINPAETPTLIVFSNPPEPSQVGAKTRNIEQLSSPSTTAFIDVQRPQIQDPGLLYE